MNNQGNPFIVGVPVPPARFIGRQTQVNACLNAMVNRTHIAIHGSPGMGKSSLLRYVVDPQLWKAKGVDASKVVFAGINCADLDPFTPPDFWRTVLMRVKSGSPAGAAWISELDQRLMKPMVDAHDLEAVLTCFEAAGSALVLTVDDYDDALRTNDHYTADDLSKFVTDVRALSNQFGTKCFSTIIGSFYRLYDLGPKVKPSGSPWYNHYLFEPLPPFTADDTAALFERMPMKWTLSQLTRDWLNSLADRHPALLQNACDLLYRIMDEDMATDWATFARELRGRTMQFFRAEWDFSDDKEKKLMLLATLARLEGRVPGHDYRVGDLNLVFSQAAESQEFMRLESRGILLHRTEGTKHVFEFRSSMMAWWVLQWIEDSPDEAELKERQKILFGLSTKQVEQIKSVMGQIWHNKDAVKEVAKFAGEVAGAAVKGFLGQK
jgi:hypothetical protein